MFEYALLEQLSLFHILSAGRFNSVLIALILVSLLGMMMGPAWGNTNPMLWGLLDKICGRLVLRTYNVKRSVQSLHFRGAFLLTLYLFITGVIAAVALLIERRFSLVGFMNPLLLSLTMSGGATWSALIKLQHALRAKKGLSKGGYYQVAVSSRTNLNSTDDHGIIRVGIGLVVTNFDKGLVAPVFWYMIGGLPAAYIYCGVAAARWSLSKDGFAKGIGALALQLEKFFGFFPQIFSCFFIMLGAFVTPDASMYRAVKSLFSTHGKAPYAEGGAPLSIMAYAMKVSLGGPVEDISGSVLKRAWVGDAQSSAKVERKHLRIGIYLGIMSFVWVSLFIVMGMAGYRIFA